MPWPEDSGGPPRPSHSGRLVLASGSLRPSPSATSSSRSCTSSSGSAVSPTAYRILCLRFACLVRLSLGSATDARLDTGGWLALTRQGLSPRKIRQASLGATTTNLTGALILRVWVEREVRTIDELFSHRFYRLPRKRGGARLRGRKHHGFPKASWPIIPK